jgi:hypothetical protein
MTVKIKPRKKPPPQVQANRTRAWDILMTRGVYSHLVNLQTNYKSPLLQEAIDLILVFHKVQFGKEIPR